MSHETLLKFCSPTLAGIKVSNLVNVKFICLSKLLNEIKIKNKLLNSKGIYIEIVKLQDNRALIYVYRKSALLKILSNQDNQTFLKGYNYTNFDIEGALELLKLHIADVDFPHEIGVFLGYPLSDVIAFIENKGKNEQYVGCWKAYSNPEYAKDVFNQYKQCTKTFCDKFALGTDIIKLTVAC